MDCQFYEPVRVRGAGDGYLKRWTGKCGWCGRYVPAQFVEDVGSGRHVGTLVAHTQAEPNWATPQQWARS